MSYSSNHFDFNHLTEALFCHQFLFRFSIISKFGRVLVVFFDVVHYLGIRIADSSKSIKTFFKIKIARA